MKLSFEQLSRHLQNRVYPLYLLSSDEVVLIEESLATLTACAVQHGFDEKHISTVDTHFDWDAWLLSTQTNSLFAQRQLHILHIRTGKPGDKGAKALQKFCERRDADTLLFIVCPRLDAASLKTKWYQALDTFGVTMQIWPLGVQEQKNWFLNHIRAAQLSIEPLALDWIMQQNTGNLLAMKQIIEQLKLLFEPQTTIKLTDLTELISDQAEFDIFKLVDSCDAGNQKTCIRIVQKLHEMGTEPILILWALTRELRQLYEMHTKLKKGERLDIIFRDFRVLPVRKRVVESALVRLTPLTMHRLLSEAANIDAIIKGALMLPLWPTLEAWCLSYCGGM
ncbi:MAG: DNA polymerase III subunit delta [Gammaproteobacteria bacterium]|nr:DNA polymerase III subunit delta [Gammaproteobacteria bacterium]